jgi:hypothetical protein
MGCGVWQLIQCPHACAAGAVPELVSAWQGVAQAECQRALAAALQLLDSGFKEDPNMDEAELYEMYKVGVLGVAGHRHADRWLDLQLTSYNTSASKQHVHGVAFRLSHTVFCSVGMITACPFFCEALLARCGCL